jgi:two-component system, NarL family, response regulator NreC
MKTIRVLLVDDHAIVRAGLRALLDASEDVHVIGEAENGQQAVGVAERLRPDVVMLDFAMPLLNGLEAARHIAHKVPTARVLILSSYSDAQHVRQAVAAGVAGYVMKQSAGTDLLEAIRETANGGAYFSPPLLSHLLKGWLEMWACGPNAHPSAPALSTRHAEVLQLIAEGYCTKQIAALLFISLKTAERHRFVLMSKLKLHKVAALTRYGVSSGVVESNRAPNWPATPVPQVGEQRPSMM